MISFRYHVVSLTAVLLALAAGIVLGGGPLQRSVAADGGGADQQALAAAEERAGDLEARLRSTESYVEATTGSTVRGALRGRAVTLLTLPGADQDAVDGIVATVARAGGAVTARVAATEELLDVGNRQLVETLAAQLEDSADGVAVPAGASGYERVGRLLAHAVATRRPAGRPVDDAGEGILAGLTTAELVTVQGEAGRRGGLVLVVAGAPRGTADTRAGAGSIVATLASALDGGSRGVVLAGPPSAAAEDGLVGAVRADAAAGRVSTVDLAGSPVGAVTATLALAAEARGRAGHYGSTSAPDGAVPARLE